MAEITGPTDEPPLEDDATPAWTPWWLQRADTGPPVGGPPERMPDPHLYETTRPTEEPPPAAGRGRHPLWMVAAVALASALVGGAIVGGSLLWFGGDDTDAAPPGTVVERVETRVLETLATGDAAVSASEVARRVLPSVVMVERGLPGEEGFVRTGGGSGVVLDTDGHIVTNYHVIEGAEAVRVALNDGRIFPATVVGSDSLTDLAVLTVDIDGLVPIVLGSTQAMSVGDTAYALGNPLTLEGGPSVTSGVISAFDRRVLLPGGRELFGMLQTDAPITRGSSGGALVDEEGRLIGITSAVGVSDLGAEGLGFAIPVELVARITADLIADGSTTHAFLGVSGSTHLAENTDGSIEPGGVAVDEAIEGTAADVAGLLPGDIIVSFDGVPITTMEQLVVRLRFTRVGDVIALGVLRDGETTTVEVELLARPEGV